MASGAISHGRKGREFAQGYVVVLTVFDLTVSVRPAVIVPPVTAVAVRSALTCICIVRSIPWRSVPSWTFRLVAVFAKQSMKSVLTLSDCFQFCEDSITHFCGADLFHAVLHDVTGAQALVEGRCNGGFNSVGPVAHAE